MKTNIDLVTAILADKSLMRIPHRELDCQAAVEKALSLIGVNVNYKGSNHMWREMVTDRDSILGYRSDHGELVPGMIAFTLRQDGGEKLRGYNDDYGNATHVGIIIDNERVFQSGVRGTEVCKLSNTSFNSVAFCKHIAYTGELSVDTDRDKKSIALIEEALKNLKEVLTLWES